MAERVEIAGNRACVAENVEVGERLAERQRADFLVGPIGLPIMGNVSFLPIFPERAHVDVRSAIFAEDRAKAIVRTVPYADEGAENVERKQHGQNSRASRATELAFHLRADGAIEMR